MNQCKTGGLVSWRCGLWSVDCRGAQAHNGRHNHQEIDMSSNTEATYIVRASAIQAEHLLEQEDRAVVGDHTITLPADAPGWSEGRQATCVLDVFHSTVPVGMLEDFEFSVIAPDGREIFED